MLRAQREGAARVDGAGEGERLPERGGAEPAPLAELEHELQLAILRHSFDLLTGSPPGRTVDSGQEDEDKDKDSRAREGEEPM